MLLQSKQTLCRHKPYPSVQVEPIILKSQSTFDVRKLFSSKVYFYGKPQPTKSNYLVPVWTSLKA